MSRRSLVIAIAIGMLFGRLAALATTDRRRHDAGADVEDRKDNE